MAIDKDAIARLVALQELDRRLDDLKAAIARVPEDVAALREEVRQEKERVQQAKAKSQAIQLKRKEKELEMSQKEQAIRKHQQELNQVKSNEAFKALLKEIDEAKAQVGDLETEILTLMEEADAAAREEKALLGEIQKFEADREAQVKVLEQRKAELERELAGQEERRQAALEGVPAEALSVYDQTRRRRAGVAMAPVDGGKNCGVCRITVRPQAILNLTKGRSLEFCDGCQRILYLAEAAAKPAS